MDDPHEFGDDVPVYDNVLELVNAVLPITKSTNSIQEAEDVILHLEETDERFHKYAHVKYIRRRLATGMTSLIEDELEKRRHNTSDDIVPTRDHEILINAVSEKVTRTPQFQALFSSLMAETKVAVNHIIQEQQFEDSPRNQDIHINMETVGNKDSYIIYSDMDSTNSTCNQSPFPFLNYKQFTEVVHQLDVSQSIATRRSAMNKLCQLPATESVSGNNWSLIKQGLMDALADPDQILEERCLKYFARVLSSAPFHFSKDVYLALVEHISLCFSRRNSNKRIADGLSCNDVIVRYMLQRFRLLNEYQTDISNFWIRYNDRYMDEVIESTVNLFCKNSFPRLSDEEYITPLHFLCLIDPTAIWYKQWMHPHYSRISVFKAVGNHRYFLENAVRHLLDYQLTRVRSDDLLSQLTQSLLGQHMQEESSHNGLFYTEADIEFLHIIHSINIIGKFLLYKRGREFFPIKLRERQSPVTIAETVTALITMVTEPCFSRGSKSLTTMESTAMYNYDPAVLVSHAINEISNRKDSCQACLCNQKAIDVLIKPVKIWVDVDEWEDIEGQWSLPAESTMLYIADILSHIVATSHGRRLILYGSNCTGNTDDNNIGSVSTIVNFVARGLTNDLQNLNVNLSKVVIGAYVYVLRQLYATNDGMLSLKNFNLHENIVEAWIVANREASLADTPTPAGKGTMKNLIFMWEETLIDNLLNLGATPKGINLLHVSGATNECIAYMCTRYAKKLQVSKCEKFGYGLMVTQVSSTPPGVSALNQSGYMKLLIRELWEVLEYPSDGGQSIYPALYPIDPLTRASKKLLVKLVNVAAGFPSLIQLLEPIKLGSVYSLRDVPGDLTELISRLVILDTPNKFHSLLNVEQSHTFGLRLINIICCSLDNLLILNTKVNIRDRLLDLQRDNMVHGKCIYDMETLERNHVIVRMSLIGGNLERCLPSRCLVNTLSTKAKPYKHTLFTSPTLPAEYVRKLSVKSSLRQGSELSKLLASTKPNDISQGWLEKCQQLLMTLLSTKPELVKSNVVGELIDKVTKIEDYSSGLEAITIPTVNANSKMGLSEVETAGIKMIVRYGLQLKLLANERDSQTALTQLMVQTKMGLMEQQEETPQSALKFLAGSYYGVDWLLATVFLLMSGNRDRCIRILQQFSACLTSAYIWPARMFKSKYLPESLRNYGVEPMVTNLGHFVELVVEAEIPLVAQSFRLSGLTASKISQHWLRQCFWNYLNWPEVVNFIALVITSGPDYIVYFCVAVMRHLQDSILLHTQHRELTIFLLEEPITLFHVGKCLPFIKTLQARYSQMILKELAKLDES